MKAKRKLVIFGATAFAERAKYFFDAFSAYETACFTVDRDYRLRDELDGVPLVDFETIVEKYPPTDHALFVAAGYRDLNATRQRVFSEAGASGYDLASFVSSKASIHASTIGAGSFITDNVVVGPFVTAGSGLVISPNTVIGHHSIMGEFTYISAGVTVSGGCSVGARCYIGAGSVLRDGITVADGTFVGMGSVVTKDIIEPGVYFGQPARKK